jgi:tetratricopeptide (TPR) repeat protein
VTVRAGVVRRLGIAAAAAWTLAGADGSALQPARTSPAAAPAAPAAPAPAAPPPATPAPAASSPAPAAGGTSSRRVPDASLARLEAAVAAEPDSLRAASEYRLAVIRAGEYDRAIDFFANLVAGHAEAANAWLNFGYCYVDKIPAAGAITRVILANQAVERFSRAIELRRSWLALYTRGNSYLYWPKIFGRGPLGVADLEEAMAIARRGPRRPYHVHGYAALGDGYWRTDQPARAAAIWAEGARLFPRDPQLQARLARQGDDLDAYVASQHDPDQRVDTDLREVWENP